MSREIVVVDYGCGNIGSVLNMINRAGGEASASGHPEVLMNAAKLLLPGVGSFDNAVKKLKQSGLVEVLHERADAGVPILGICLGMQLLSHGSEEGLLPGLSLIPGVVRRFRFPADKCLLKIPHMGWNNVTTCRNHPIAEGLESGARFYFVHSYYYDCENPADELFKTHYGHDFTSAVQRGNVIGVQFHPEKSHRFGMKLFRNFIDL